ncbi:Cytosolic copper metallochaperone [Myotisia sp. PD_48]|nr:Cytosolic copper metallochaperone [Myotisia sp. PD_48]
MDTNQFTFGVKMSCSGCSGAVTRALKKREGVKDITIDMDKQEVKVETDPAVTYEDILNAIKETGKTVTSDPPSTEAKPAGLE